MSIWGNPVMIGSSEGGGGGIDTLWILNPDIMDAQVAAWPYSSTITPSSSSNVNYGSSTLAFAPIVVKIHGSAYSSMCGNWLSQKGTYADVADKAFLGRYGYDRSGLFFATKIPAATYSTLHIRFEITSGSFSSGYLAVYLTKSMTYQSDDVYPESSEVLYSQTLANSLQSDTEVTIDVSGIANDFYLSFVDWNGFSKLRSIYLT